MSKPEQVDLELDRDTLHDLFTASQVGRCVNSVTHDVNNLLGAIMAYGELVGLDAGLEEESQRMLADMMTAIRKSSALMGQLTSIAREERDLATSVRMHQFLDRSLDLRRYDIKVQQIALEVSAEPDERFWTVDEPKLTRALLYLISNAIEATVDTTPRVISLTLTTNQERAEIAVSNSGPVVPEGERATIFEPLYTTKRDGHLGMGLFLARKYLEHHRGSLDYEPSRGFVMTVPADTGLETTQIA